MSESILKTIQNQELKPEKIKNKHFTWTPSYYEQAKETLDFIKDTITRKKDIEEKKEKKQDKEKEVRN